MQPRHGNPDCPECGNEMYPDGGTGSSCGACGTWLLWWPKPPKRRAQRPKQK